MARSPRIALGALLGVLASAHVTFAQVIEVPTVEVGPAAGTDWFPTYQGFSVAAGADGGFAVAWHERHTSNGGMTDKWALVTEAFTATGAPRRAADRIEARTEILGATALAGFASGYAVAFGSGKTLPELHLRSQFLALDGAPLHQGDVSEDSRLSHDPPLVASMSAGSVFVWARQENVRVVTASLWNQLGQPRSSPIDVAADPAIGLGVAGTHDGGFVVAFEGDRLPKARFFDANGVAQGPVLEPGVPGRLARLAASPAGDVVALALLRRQPDQTDELWIQRIDSTGATLGAATFVSGGLIQPDLEFDRNGNLYVVWANGLGPARARVFDRDGIPVGSVTEIAAPVHNGVRTARLADSSRFVNFWQVSGRHYANVVSLCTPGTSICGDGVFDAFCERCDAGAGNSDTTPDACRSDCELPRCGDGVSDGGEECDDGNATSCDGCSACRVDVGLGCGDGVAIPTCGETCDDANAVVGDGCAPDCRLERVPGGGPAPTDCFTAWSIDNPANQPLLDKKGAFSRLQICADDDPRCDFDGGTPGSCTFHLRVCANNTDLAACTPGSRLASWSLRSPSASRAEHDPIAAAQRDALGAAVLPNVVGPSDRDLCSPTAAVVVPLRPGNRTAKASLKTEAALYTGVRDIDKLRLICVPATP